MKSICIVVSSPGTVKAFLTEQIDALSERYQVCLVLNIANSDSPLGLNSKVEVVAAPVVRNISVFRDLCALLFLITLFSRRRFDAIHSITPKAGFLAALAGAIVRIPVRIHTFTGQVWATRSGPARLILKTADRLLARLATHILVDSSSQRNFLISEKVVSAKKSRVLGNGSICGVDTLRFRPDFESRKGIRDREGIGEDSFVFLYVGRLKVDKGVLDLAQAFVGLAMNRPNAWLFIVGPDEDGVRHRIEKSCMPVAGRLRFFGLTTAPQEYMAAADVLVLPSYREGFGSVIIEAASVGIPALASNIYGITDAIQPGVTGLLHAAGDVASLQSKMKQIMEDPESRTIMGADARTRVHRDFSKELVTSALLAFYGPVVQVDSQGGDSECGAAAKRSDRGAETVGRIN